MTRSHPKPSQRLAPALGFALLLATRPARLEAQAAPATVAKSTEASDAEYKELVRSALVEMEAHNYAEARALFLRAHAMQPSARTLRALGNAEFELKRYAQAIRYFNAALASTEHALTADMRTEMLRALTRAESYCGRFELALTPATAQLTVDGAPAQREPDATLLLDLGDHTLALTAAGYLTSQRTLSVGGGEHSRLAWALTPAQVASLGAAASESGARDAHGGASAHDSILKQWWFWTAIGVVATGTVVGIAVASSGGGATQAPLEGNLGQSRALLQITR